MIFIMKTSWTTVLIIQSNCLKYVQKFIWQEHKIYKSYMPKNNISRYRKRKFYNIIYCQIVDIMASDFNKQTYFLFIKQKMSIIAVIAINSLITYKEEKWRIDAKDLF